MRLEEIYLSSMGTLACTGTLRKIRNFVLLVFCLGIGRKTALACKRYLNTGRSLAVTVHRLPWRYDVFCLSSMGTFIPSGLQKKLRVFLWGWYFSCNNFAPRRFAKKRVLSSLSMRTNSVGKSVSLVVLD